MRRTRLTDGTSLSVIGQGTWRMGEDPAERSREAAALREGLDLGLTLIDTAEMYADGGAEQVVGEAVRGRRHEVFLVSKALPSHASRQGVAAAAERSLRRLGTDRIDLYLLHWPSSTPIAETLAGLRDLVEQGKILRYGVSNFDTDELEEALDSPGGGAIATNQILYNLSRRGPELRLIPRCRDREVAVMAYSPVEQGRLRITPALREVAGRHGIGPHAAAVAWSVRLPGMIGIPKAVRSEHLRENATAGTVTLTAEDLELLDRDHPVPDHPGPLGFL